LNIFSVVGHFFASLFGAKGGLAQKVLHEAASFVNLAQPIVAEIETEIKALPDQGKSVQAIETFLGKYETDAAKVLNIATTLAALPPADLWKNLAVTALSALAPAGTASSLLNLAVELAYNIFKQSKMAPIALQTTVPTT
jgi:hypothetical protein